MSEQQPEEAPAPQIDPGPAPVIIESDPDVLYFSPPRDADSGPIIVDSDPDIIFKGAVPDYETREG